MNQTCLRGIIIQKKSLAENDLIITFLSPDKGIQSAIAPNAKNYQSNLQGKTELLMINDFWLTRGRNLSRITQIETQENYRNLTKSIGKLTVSQYLSELVLHLALKEQSQPELYLLFTEHLRRIENVNSDEDLFPCLAQAVFHLLIVAGIAPEIYHCVITQKPLKPNFEQINWQVGFSYQGGGICQEKYSSHGQIKINEQLNALELAILQSLPRQVLRDDIQSTIPVSYDKMMIKKSWIRVERILKEYIEFYLSYKLKSAEIITDILIHF